ncbi:MAG: HlyD family efflux transporter periplasmic adaptor subunit [Verrucomicrobia bacterium]|jgi:HlyD family secretion protein|nr:HlyD family efflux transporter periplasmic adaptor subunit [Verrucomicrobiota bacterium]
MKINARSCGVFCFLPVVLVLAGCGGEEVVKEASLDSARAETRAIVDVRREDGRLQAYRIVSFVPSLGDLKLRSVHVNEGDLVQSGDELFTFDTEPLMEQIAVLELRTNTLARKIEAARYHAEVKAPAQAQIDLINAKLSYEDAVRTARTREQMSEGGLASKAALDRALQTKEGALLALDLAKRGVERSAAGIASTEVADLEIDLKEALRELTQLQKRLVECVGKAPFTGRVLGINAAIKDYGRDFGEEGLVFQPGRGPLMIVADTSRIRIIANFFETAVALIETGQRAEVQAEHVPDEVFEGKVTSISQVGHSHGQASTVSVEVIVDNSRGLLKPGLTAEVRIVVARKDAALSIPARFLRSSEAGYSVRRKCESGSERITVEIGISDRDFVEVLSGLEPGDEVVMER